MTKQRQRKSLNWGQLYRPDPSTLRHQRYCSAPICRKASKAASKARWRSRPQNRNYFRGPEKDHNFKPVVLMQLHAVDSNPNAPERSATSPRKSAPCPPRPIQYSPVGAATYRQNGMLPYVAPNATRSSPISRYNTQVAVMSRADDVSATLNSNSKSPTSDGGRPTGAADVQELPLAPNTLHTTQAIRCQRRSSFSCGSFLNP